MSDEKATRNTQNGEEEASGENLPLVCVASIDNLPVDILRQIRRWYAEKRRYAWMSEQLADLGYQCNHTKLYYYCRANFRGLTRFDGPIDEDNIDELRVDQERTAISAGLDIALEAMRSIKIPKAKTIDEFNKLCSAVAKLVNAACMRDRIIVDEGRGADKLRAQFIHEVKRELVDYPDVVQKLVDAVNNAYQNVIE